MVSVNALRHRELLRLDCVPAKVPFSLPPGHRLWQLLWVNLEGKQQIPSLLKDVRTPFVGEHTDLQKPVELGPRLCGEAMLEPGSGQTIGACPNLFHTRAKYVH